MKKSKISIFALEQENTPHVYQGQEVYVANISDDNKHIHESTDKVNI